MSASTSNGNGISQRKLAANRANAQKSTGPRTQQGKRKSSLNAQTHALRSRLSTDALVCQHEREDFQALSQALREELNPQTPLQHLLAERLALLAWKMRRTAAAEAALLDDTLTWRRQNQQQDNDRARRRNTESPKIKPLPTAADLVAQHARSPARQNPWLTLHRYDQATQREFHKTLKQYQSLQRRQEEDLDEETLLDIHSAGPNEPTDSPDELAEPNEPTEAVPEDPDAPQTEPPTPVLASSRESSGPNEPTDDPTLDDPHPCPLPDGPEGEGATEGPSPGSLPKQVLG